MVEEDETPTSVFEIPRQIAAFPRITAERRARDDPFPSPRGEWTRTAGAIEDLPIEQPAGSDLVLAAEVTASCATVLVAAVLALVGVIGGTLLVWYRTC